MLSYICSGEATGVGFQPQAKVEATPEGGKCMNAAVFDVRDGWAFVCIEIGLTAGTKVVGGEADVEKAGHRDLLH